MYSETYLQDILTRTLEVISVPPNAAIALEGSIAEGFGNPGSDIDFVAINESDDESFPTIPTIAFVGGHRVEVRVRSATEMQRQLSLLRDAVATGELPDEETLDRCQRFSRSMVLRNRPLMDAIHHEVARETIDSAIAAWFAEETREAMRVVSAMLALGQEAEAENWARAALTLGAKHWLAGRGESYLAKKWLSHQLTRASDAALRERILMLESPKRSGHHGAAYVKEVALLLQSVGLKGCSVDERSVVLRRLPSVTTWQIGSRLHVVRDKRELFALSDEAAAVWRSLSFEKPLAGVVARTREASPLAPRLIAEFQRLGLIKFGSVGGAEITARKATTMLPMRTLPVLCLDGVIFSDDDTAHIKLAPILAARVASAGMELVYVNMVFENAREDAVGALKGGQWQVLERSIRRMVRFASRALFSAAGVNPLPPVEEGYLRLGELDFISEELRTRMVNLEEGLDIGNALQAAEAIEEIDRIGAEVRKVTRSERFPSCFVSSGTWQETLEIGYDWARMGAYLDADFPLEQTRDLIATASQPRVQRTRDDLPKVGQPRSAEGAGAVGGRL